MTITIKIEERPNGEVAVHIHQAAGMVSVREDIYATVITASIKAHLAKEMPALVKKVLAQEGS